MKTQKVILIEDHTVYRQTIRQTLGPFIDILRSGNKEIPILVISKIRYARELVDPTQLKEAVERARLQEELVQQRRDAGDPNLHFLNGESLLGEHPDEGTVDGVHPTDLGFMMMADRIEPVVRSILMP